MTLDVAAIRFDELRKFCAQSEGSLRRDRSEFHTRVRGQAILADPTDIAAQHYIESLGEELDEIENTFPQILRRSLFIQSCADFEYFLMKVARCFERTSAVTYFDFRGGKGITKSKEYLKKAGVVFPAGKKAWQDIEQLFDVRNVVVHVNGTIVEDPKHDKLKEHKKVAEKFLARWPKDAELDNLRQLTFSANLVPQVLDLFEAFFAELRRHVLAAIKNDDE